MCTSARILGIALAAALAGCGQKGPLVLPPQPATPVSRPAPAAPPATPAPLDRPAPTPDGDGRATK
jgi:predicted small lipoprotein YifL